MIPFSSSIYLLYLGPRTPASSAFPPASMTVLCQSPLLVAPLLPGLLTLEGQDSVLSSSLLYSLPSGISSSVLALNPTYMSTTLKFLSPALTQLSNSTHISNCLLTISTGMPSKYLRLNMPQTNLLSKPAPLETFPISVDGNGVLLIFQAKVFSSGQTCLSVTYTPNKSKILSILSFIFHTLYRIFFRNSSFTNSTFKYIHNLTTSHHLCCYQPGARHLLPGLPSDLLTDLPESKLASLQSILGIVLIVIL